MNALDQLRERASKREENLIREREKKEAKEGELQRVKQEVFRATKAIYIEPRTSRSPPIFQESNESSREGRNVE